MTRASCFIGARHLRSGEVAGSVDHWSADVEARLVEARVESLTIREWSSPGLEPLGALASDLKRLAIECPVQDLDALALLPRLEELALSRHISLAQIDFGRLTRLRHLTLFGASDWGNVAACHSLRAVTLDGCDSQDLSRLADLNAVEQLVLREAKVRSLAGIEGMQALRRVFLGQLPIADLSPLGALCRLQVLSLYALSRVVSVAPIRELQGLWSLRVESCPKAQDVARIGEMAQLEKLVIQKAGMTDASFLFGLTRLRILSLEGMGDELVLPVVAKLSELECVEFPEEAVGGEEHLPLLALLPRLNTLFLVSSRQQELVLPALRAEWGEVYVHGGFLLRYPIGDPRLAFAWAVLDAGMNVNGCPT